MGNKGENMGEIKKLDDFELSIIAGGMPNPVSGMSYEKAWKIAKKWEVEARKKGIKKGQWGTGESFMRWWVSNNKDSREYLDHKKEVDKYIQGGKILNGEALSNSNTTVL